MRPLTDDEIERIRRSTAACTRCARLGWARHPGISGTFDEESGARRIEFTCHARIDVVTVQESYWNRTILRRFRPFFLERFPIGQLYVVDPDNRFRPYVPRGDETRFLVEEELSQRVDRPVNLSDGMNRAEDLPPVMNSYDESDDPGLPTGPLVARGHAKEDCPAAKLQIPCRRHPDVYRAPPAEEYRPARRHFFRQRYVEDIEVEVPPVRKGSRRSRRKSSGEKYESSGEEYEVSLDLSLAAGPATNEIRVDLNGRPAETDEAFRRRERAWNLYRRDPGDRTYPIGENGTFDVIDSDGVADRWRWVTRYFPIDVLYGGGLIEAIRTFIDLEVRATEWVRALPTIPTGRLGQSPIRYDSSNGFPVPVVQSTSHIREFRRWFRRQAAAACTFLAETQGIPLDQIDRAREIFYEVVARAPAQAYVIPDIPEEYRRGPPPTEAEA